MSKKEGGNIIPFPEKRPKVTVENYKGDKDVITEDQGRLGDRRLAELNEGKRKDLELDDNGRLLYPEELETITIEEALEIAKEIIGLYNPEKIQEDIEEEKRNFPLNKNDVELFQEQARLKSVDELRRFFGWHKMEPGKYPPERLYAVACELVKHFEEPK